MKVTLISHTPNAAALLAFTKRTRLEMDVQTFHNMLDLPDAALLEELEYMSNTIPSSWEFVDYVFLVQGVSRAYTHQQVRTRAASYAQQTLRVLDVSKGFDYVTTRRNEEDPKAMALIERCLRTIRGTYAELIRLGQPPEDARGILPTNIATNICCKFNLRTMSELARSRTGGRTQQEYQGVINAMCDAVIAVHPWAESFLFSKGRHIFDEMEEIIREEWPNDLMKRGKFLKALDQMRKDLT